MKRTLSVSLVWLSVVILTIAHYEKRLSTTHAFHRRAVDNLIASHKVILKDRDDLIGKLCEIQPPRQLAAKDPVPFGDTAVEPARVYGKTTLQIFRNRYAGCKTVQGRIDTDSAYCIGDVVFYHTVDESEHVYPSLKYRWHAMRLLTGYTGGLYYEPLNYCWEREKAAGKLARQIGKDLADASYSWVGGGTIHKWLGTIGNNPKPPPMDPPPK